MYKEGVTAAANGGCKSESVQQACDTVVKGAVCVCVPRGTGRRPPRRRDAEDGGEVVAWVMVVHGGKKSTSEGMVAG